MAINYSNLSVYVDQLSQPIISKAVLEGRTAQVVDVIQGVKYSEQINIMDINPYIVQPNSVGNNGFTDSGTTILSAITAVACPLKINNAFILEGANSLEQYWYGQLMKQGSYQENAPQFEAAFMDLLAKYTSQASDSVVWMGGYTPSGSNAHSADTAGNGGYLVGCLGILNQVYNTAVSAQTITVSYSGAPTVSTIYGIVEAIIAAIPDNMLMLPNISIWCKPGYIDMYKRAIMGLNNNTGNYWFGVESLGSTATSDLDIRVPGRRNITLRGTPGLGVIVGQTGNGYQGFICSNDNNLAVITDNQNDYEKTKIWFSNDYDQLRATTKFKAGGICKLAQQVIVY